MALVRCEACGRPKGIKRVYICAVAPVGYPETAAVCGRARCDHPGMVWLDASEKADYDRGQRVFLVPNAAIKIRAS